jgi:hypothetical protein
MLWLFVLIGGVLIFASLIDYKRKKIKNNGLHPINSHAKPGEDKNFTIGSHRHHDGIGGSGGDS